MAEPFLGEIRIASWNYNTQGWAQCNGQLLPINQNQALFALLGTTYGGNGQTTFALPDLRDRAPFHHGGSFSQGQTGGEIAHTLTNSEMPAHIHLVNAVAPPDSTTNTNIPTGAFLSNSAPAEIYKSNTGNPGLLTPIPETISSVGGSQPHNNMQPYLALNFIIALIGIFPTQS
jgi:microcystin-dependent protein